MFLDYNFRNYNYRLFLYVLLLNITGVLIIRSASNQDASMVMKQIVGILVGLTAVVILSLVDYHKVVSVAPLIYGTSLAFLLAVLVFGVSRGVARRWLVLPVIGQIQPSEFVKISFVFFVAAMFYQSTDRETIIKTTVVAALHVLVLVLSKDLGSALIFFVAYMTMLFVATSSYLWFGAGIAGGSLAAVAAYYLFPHVRRRVEAWADPWSDIANKGYQVAQALFAIGTGGWFGMGLYRGMPEKIPVVDKDFVFAAISEEMGALYALCVLFLCLGCYMQFMLIAMKMQAMFYKLIAFGLGSVYITQVFLTIGGVTKFIPSTGVTLPLVSYGGSSIVSTFIIFQVIQGLYVLKRGEEEEEENSSEEE